MNPTIKKLPKSVQSLICASNQINSYTKAVQELVFNALDAESTSIAVRINIAEGSLQVVDNGCGISQADFKYIGQNYMTSKLLDISTLKSAPNKYGIQGRSLANLVQISKTLKVTSRFYKCETTCVKIFENGRTKSTAKCSSRPSKGTTIEIKDFLYNLSIQKKSIDLLSELQSIKTFLEHISLVHCSISLSLRDDSKNEIVYKIHKNRDMYQTLSTLYEIEKTNVKELKVEKNQYKVNAYVGKCDVETNAHLIFLNGKSISDSSLLHKKVNENFKKHLRGGKQKIKKNVYNDEENHIFRNKIPFYFIFITCPYMDYELTNMILEFKDWGQINTILEKLVKFYIGDLQLQVIPKNKKKKFFRKHESESTKIQIEKIMQHILGNHGKKPAISQMQNGIKGKLIKRKNKNKNNLLREGSKNNYKQQKLTEQVPNDALINEQNSNKICSSTKIRPMPENTKNLKEHRSTTAITKTSNKKTKPKIPRKPSANHITKTKNKSKITSQKQPHLNNKTNRQSKQNGIRRARKVSLNKKFAMATESVKRRCELLAQQTKELIENNEGNPKISRNENVQITHSNFVNSNRNITVHKKVNEIVIHEYIPKSKCNNNRKIFKTNYDLLQTILSSQREINNSKECMSAQNCDIPDLTDKTLRPFEKVVSSHNLVPLVRNLYNPIQSKTSDLNIFSEIDKKMPLSQTTPDDNVRSFGRDLDDISSFQIPKPRYRMQAKESEDDIPFLGDTDEIFKASATKSDDNFLFRSATLDSNVSPNWLSASNDSSPFQIVTFQSHNYFEQEFRNDTNMELYNFCKRPRNFITTQSRENFTMFPEHNRFKGNKTNFYSKQLQVNKPKSKLKKPTLMFDIENTTDIGIRESFMIEFTKSIECINTPMHNNNNNIKYDTLHTTSRKNFRDYQAITPSMSYIFNDPRHQSVSPVIRKTGLSLKNDKEKDNDLDYEPINRNTYPITSSYNYNNIHITFNREDFNGTYTIEKNNKSGYENKTTEMIRNFDDNSSDYNTVFVPKSQETDDDIQTINPIDVCETVLEDKGLSMNLIREFNMSFKSKQDSSDHFIVDSNKINKMEMPLNELLIYKKSIEFPRSSFHDENELNIPLIPKSQEELTEVSHHFILPNSNISIQNSSIQVCNHGSTSKEKYYDKITSNKQNKDVVGLNVLVNGKNDTGAFNIRNRMFFVPKGNVERKSRKLFNWDRTFV